MSIDQLREKSEKKTATNIHDQSTVWEFKIPQETMDATC